MEQKNDGRSCLMLVSSLLIIGTIGVFRRFIPLSSSLLAFSRGLIGALSLLAFAAVTKKLGKQKIPLKKLLGVILGGVFLGLNWILFFESVELTSVPKATLAYYMQPTVVLLLSPLVFKEKLTLRKLVCAAFALFGMVLVSGVLFESPEKNDLRGILCALGAACFYSLIVILNKKIEGIEQYPKTIIQLAASAAVLLPYLLIRSELSGLELDGKTVVLLLILGVVHTGVVYALFFGSMNGLRAQTISALTYIDPVAAMIFSAIFLGEKLSYLGLVGAALIIGSAVISELLPAAARSRKA